jgi:hypothetical protein
MQMDMTDQEGNETRVATFNHQDPYEVSLLDEPSTEEPPVNAEPPVSNELISPSDDDDEIIPSIPVEMKESLSEYIDEDLAASVKSLIEKVTSLESALHTERRKTKAVSRASETADKFTGLWNTESVKFSGVLEDPSARSRVEQSFKVLEAGYKASGTAVPSMADLFNKAVTSEFGASMVAAREKEITDQMSKRQSQFVSRANSGAQAVERPEDRAARAVARIMADRGIR